MKCELLEVPPGVAFTPAQWKQATKHEMEHTKDPICAAVIGAQHMVEHANYYPGLEKMEQALEKQEAGLSDYTPNPGLREVWAVASVLSTALSAYHGYKRNDSIGWAIVWGLLGGAFPVITPTIAYAQGFGERKGS
jgi:hypothetical protein